MTDHEPLKSPTCHDCARDRELYVPGDVHSGWQGTCANCGCDGFVSSAADWREVSPTPTDLEKRLLEAAATSVRNRSADEDDELFREAAYELEHLRTALHKIADMGLGAFGNRPADVARRALGLDNG